MFLEIKGIKKHYGEGDSRVDVLKGIDIEIEKASSFDEIINTASDVSRQINVFCAVQLKADG